MSGKAEKEAWPVPMGCGDGAQVCSGEMTISVCLIFLVFRLSA